MSLSELVLLFVAVLSAFAWGHCTAQVKHEREKRLDCEGRQPVIPPCIVGDPRAAQGKELDLRELREARLRKGRK